MFNHILIVIKSTSLNYIYIIYSANGIIRTICQCYTCLPKSWDGGWGGGGLHIRQFDVQSQLE